MYSSLLALKTVCPEAEIAVATLDFRKELFCEKIESITYYLLPEKSRQRYDRSLEAYWKRIKADFCPDVVHIHGTEQPHGLAYLKACGNERVASSVQGFIYICVSFFLTGLSWNDLLFSISIGDLLRARILWTRKLSFFLRGSIEQKHVKLLKNVIGRTAWDCAHTRALNPEVRYFRVDETLREEFYSGTWEYSKCNPHTIFLSQAGYPIKGLHFLIKALPYVLREFPQTQVFIGGGNILKRERGFLPGYGKLCLRLMKKRGIADRFHFLGALSAEKMKEQYLSANVFVCPSTIENSPNSLCEAQILGTPIVSSDVGGVLDLVEHGKTGFVYRCEDVELLAYWICEVFRAREKMNEFVPAMQAVAQLRHDSRNNAEQLLSVYQTIIQR